MSTKKQTEEGKPKKQEPKFVNPEVKKRHALEELLKRRFFYTVSYEIYNGVKGLYDYGPPGSAMSSNIIDFWREFFILEENMLQIQTASLTPEIVFKTSGHVDKFQDYMVRDSVNGECYRADHLLEETISELIQKSNSPSERKQLESVMNLIDNFTCEELGQELKKYNVKAPDSGNDVSDPFPFNLMFSTQIGPTGKVKGYLRPETAQGMFVNFPRLLEQNSNKLPFAAAQIGPAFRNEIAPRSGLLRVREFTLAEIEHFVDPSNKSHPKFSSVKKYVLPLWNKNSQMNNTDITLLSIGEAVEKGIVNNETLGYFLVRVHQFLIKIGALPDKVRFRQHLQNEMAHYACDCWDAEIFTSYGWIECVGNADRACYDLSVHQRASGANLTVFLPFPDGPREELVTSVEVDKGALGSSLKGKAQPVFKFLEEIKDNSEKIKVIEKEAAEAENGVITIAGVPVKTSWLKFTQQLKKESGREVQPSVIEPSFGLGRILYCLLEHAYWVREDNDQRGVLSLKPIVAPYKVSVLLLVNDPALFEVIPRLVKLLTKNRISHKTDTTGVTVGRRYARTDELGIPFGITIDFEGLPDDTVTLRERDSMLQVRVKINSLPSLLRSLIDEEVTWEQVRATHVNVVVKEH